mmetsp:Transcript_21294/g.81271  ORF Transcript_21294/g.81271 Transcript_21294/m.81271 type:complete len:332 (-) Transcript_21294:23-1018(-)
MLGEGPSTLPVRVERALRLAVGARVAAIRHTLGWVVCLAPQAVHLHSSRKVPHACPHLPERRLPVLREVEVLLHEQHVVRRDVSDGIRKRWPCHHVAVVLRGGHDAEAVLLAQVNVPLAGGVNEEHQLVGQVQQPPRLPRLQRRSQRPRRLVRDGDECQRLAGRLVGWHHLVAAQLVVVVKQNGLITSRCLHSRPELGERPIGEPGPWGGEGACQPLASGVDCLGLGGHCAADSRRRSSLPAPLFEQRRVGAFFQRACLDLCLRDEVQNAAGGHEQHQGGKERQHSELGRRQAGLKAAPIDPPRFGVGVVHATEGGFAACRLGGEPGFLGL